MFGAFEKEHQDIVEKYVRGATVLDLGAGDGERAMIMYSMKPKNIIAVDYSSALEPMRIPGFHSLKTMFGELFEKNLPLIDQADVAYVSWPSNRGGMWADTTDYLVKILERISLVIYTGCNVGGTACGWMELFEHFRWRSVKSYAPSRRNTLIVYGKMTGVKRMFICHEEWAARRSFAPPYEVEMYSNTQDLFEV